MNIRSIRVRILGMTSILSIGLALYLSAAVGTHYQAMRKADQP